MGSERESFAQRNINSMEKISFEKFLDELTEEQENELFELIKARYEERLENADFYAWLDENE